MDSLDVSNELAFFAWLYIRNMTRFEKMRRNTWYGGHDFIVTDEKAAMGEIDNCTG